MLTGAFIVKKATYNNLSRIKNNEILILQDPLNIKKLIPFI
ncbi:hypothetical protein AWRIB429_1654 [Oenococcus oeni AWRIB429]|uniref:Uncharacterized protein n=1 Tax=Oenococcus oeni AWRIB429 TaxID=655225 RepID=D3LBC4_OENOE|nr:hypothetical protein AWRIB429_1654 [Oenococcus oeni AWRIB429]